MKPLVTLGAEVARSLEVVAFDLDDTLLTDGLLAPPTYSALGELGRMGLVLVAVTGRPLGYGEVLARLFPIAGVVVENGALSVRRRGHALEVVDPVADEIRLARREALRAVERDVQRELPALRFSDDMPLRRSEITYDIHERERVAEPDVQRLVAIIRRHGAWATRSSVHVHATFDRTNKAEGLIAFLRRTMPERDAGQLRQRVLFVGDSGNDAPCFAGFPHTVGVANVRPALTSLSVPPRWVTAREKGEGFRELAEHLLRLRAASASASA